MVKGNDKNVGDEYKSPISPDEPKTTPPPPGGPGSPMEIIFSFDTTGSMYSLLGEVRKNVSDLIQRLQDDIPNIRIGVIAHGDYCDEVSSYVIKMIDFSRDTESLVNFVSHVGPTGGGDGDECYELALKTARTQFSWTPGTQRSLVVIGDADPHKRDYHFYKTHTPIDWHQEVNKLKAMGVHVYGVFCNKGGVSQEFYKKIAQETDGTYLELKDFKNIFDMICAICYMEQGAEFFFAYEKEVREREKRMLNKDLDSMLKTLHKTASNASTLSLKDPDDVPPSVTLKRAAPAAVVASTPAKKSKKSPVAKATKPTKITTSSKYVTRGKIAKTKVKVAKPKVKVVQPKVKVVKPKAKPIKKLAACINVKKAVVKPRETARLIDVTVNGSHWSEWVPLVSPIETNLADVPRRHNKGYRNTTPFWVDSDKPAIYELAVTTPASRRKYVVHVCGISSQKSALDTMLFGSMPGGREMVDELTASQCTIYVRRSVVPDSGSAATVRERTRTAVKELRLKFDYAWCKNGYRRSERRTVIKNGILISGLKY